MVEKVEWPGWEIIGLIGKGAYGAVYEMQRDVFGTVEKSALKVISIPRDESEIEALLSEGYDNDSITRRYRSYLEDIIKEYSIMSKLKGNSNIVDCDDVRYEQKDDGYGWNIYIKMELLRPMLKGIGTEIRERDVVLLGRDIGHALVLCKSQNIIHRDIKPQNIFISKYGTYKLGDFGVAKISEKTSSGTVIGTFRFMAPEVYRNQPYTFSADIYSLGMVMYWMLNEKRAPFLPLPPATPTARDEENARNRRMRGETIPLPIHGSDELKRIVMKMCAFSPSARYATAEALLADLECLRTEENARFGVPGQTTRDEGAATVVESSEEDMIVKFLPTEAESTSSSEDSWLMQLKPSKQKYHIAAVFLTVVLAVALGAMLFYGTISTWQHVPLPSQRKMMTDVVALLDEQGVTGFLTKLDIQRKSVNDAYRACVTECEVTLVDQGVEYTQHVTLIYEMESDGWSVSDLSRVNS